MKVIVMMMMKNDCDEMMKLMMMEMIDDEDDESERDKWKIMKVKVIMKMVKLKVENNDDEIL